MRKMIFGVRLCVLTHLRSCPLILLGSLLNIGDWRDIQYLPLVLASVKIDHCHFIQWGQLAALSFCHFVYDFIKLLQDVVFGLQLTQNHTMRVLNFLETLIDLLSELTYFTFS